MRKGKRVLQMKRVQIMRLSNLQFSCAPFSNILSNFIVILETLEMNKRNSLHRTGVYIFYSIYSYEHVLTSIFSMLTLLSFSSNISRMKKHSSFSLHKAFKKLIFAVSNIRGNAQVALQIRFSTLTEDL